MSAPLHVGALALLVLAAKQPPGTGEHQGRDRVLAFVTAGEMSTPRRDVDLPLDGHDTPPIVETLELTAEGISIDASRIGAAGNALFPFLTLEPSFLDRIGDEERTAGRRLANPLSSGRGAGASPQLAMTDRHLQAIVDRSWSRRDRWSAFAEIRALVGAHDPDAGGLPALLRAYLDQNILQPFCDSNSRDGRFWAMLDNAADHAAFIDFVRSFTREHPSSRSTTELLFLLDELAQGSRDSLLMMLDTDPGRHLSATRAASRSVYDLAVALQRRYRDWVWDHGLHSPVAIGKRYDELRLHLLSTILESTPGRYRAADARFLAGEILFNQGNVADARQWWSAIEPDPTDAYFTAYSQILAELRSPGEASTQRIRRILQAEHGRWRMFSYDRLRRFGFRCDTF